MLNLARYSIIIIQMKHTQKHQKDTIFSIILSISVLSGIASFAGNQLHNPTIDSTLHRAASDEGIQYSSCDECSDFQQARRLQERLFNNGTSVPGISVLDQALKDRARFLRQTIEVSVHSKSTSDVPPTKWKISFAKYPELFTLHSTWSTASFVLNRNLLSEYLYADAFGAIGRVQSIVVDTTIQDGTVTRAKSTPIAQNGYEYDFQELAYRIEQALRNGSTHVTIDAPYALATVSILENGALRTLDLLATGQSDFSDSTEDRIWNVHKAVDERVNNIVIAKGATFSFVDTLGGPVTLQKGWREGLGLFGGGTAITPGAGICQAATTVYRAALLSGLPITYKRNHSMFVDHYEPYGVGLDATIFPGVHDMTFKNDTPDSVLIQSYTVGDKVFVHFYGKDDGRSVALDGPYFNTTPHRSRELRPLDSDEIGWIHTVTLADGTKKVKPIVSTYHNGFPKSVKKKYAGTPGITLLQIPVAPTDYEVASLLP